MVSKLIGYQLSQRKNAFVKICLYEGLGLSLINQKSINIYFLNNSKFLLIIKQLISLITLEKPSTLAIVSKGGGLESQGKAILLGLSKLLVRLNSNYENRLDSLGFLQSDLRIKERKKYGLRKARKAPQYSKR